MYLGNKRKENILEQNEMSENLFNSSLKRWEKHP